MKERTRRFLAKAVRSIGAAEILRRSGERDFAASRCYYAMFYTAQALLHERGLVFRKHSGILAAYGEHFAKTAALDPQFHRWLIAAFETRLEADYDVDVELGDEQIDLLLRRARDFVDAARAHLEKSDAGAQSP